MHYVNEGPHKASRSIDVFVYMWVSERVGGRMDGLRGEWGLNGARSVREQEWDEADLLLTCPVERRDTHTRTHAHSVSRQACPECWSDNLMNLPSSMCAHLLVQPLVPTSITTTLLRRGIVCVCADECDSRNVKQLTGYWTGQQLNDTCVHCWLHSEVCRIAL